MGKRIVSGILGISLFALIFIAGFGMAVQQLWNAVVPAMFNLPALGFWQAVELLALSWILFGSWRGMGVLRGRHWHMHWSKMSDAERARFRAGMEHSCGHRHRRGEQSGDANAEGDGAPKGAPK